MRIHALVVALATSAAVPAAEAAPDVPTPGLLKAAPAVSDEALFACACPGAVAFCTEWKEKWSQDAPDPRIRNQSVRECVIDFMSALSGEGAGE